ncbi:hypothetical protein [Cellulomonas chitinilytica]|uniref:hypothetical protein n=1 Tax=Cellulomonas chitinilytica TaxID=398759 RepID=UPI001941D54D|nr:hypothetical protein [Cellulomonas chitinilytica]
MDDTRRAELLGRVALAGTAASVATKNPAAGVVAAALVPLVELVHSRWLDRQRQRASDVLDQAVALAAIADDEFVERVCADPERLLLAGEALNVAARTMLEEKRDALARTIAVAATAEDATSLDGELMWLRMLAPLEAVHLRALEALAIARRDGATMQDWILDRQTQLRTAISGLEPVLQTHVLDTIVSGGLARKRFGDDYPTSYGLSTGGSAGDRFWEITVVGRQMVGRVYRRADELA